MNSDSHNEIQRNLNAHLCEICHKQKMSEVLFLHDNARPCTSVCTKDHKFLTDGVVTSTP
jgi:hypothetical protein